MKIEYPQPGHFQADYSHLSFVYSKDWVDWNYVGIWLVDISNFLMMTEFWKSKTVLIIPNC